MSRNSQDMSALSQLQGLYLSDDPQAAGANMPSTSAPQAQFQNPFQLTQDDLLSLSNPPPTQSQPLSTPDELSISPSATSLPITLADISSQPPSTYKHRDTFDFDSAHAYDFDSLDNFDYGSQGAYTPSYGSWSSSFGDEDAPPSFASFDASSQGGGSVFSDPSSLNDPHSNFASPPLPLSFQPDFSKYIDYRAMSLDQQQQQAASDIAETGRNVQRSASPIDFLAGRMEVDEHSKEHPLQAQKESTLTPSMYQLGGGTMRVSRGSGSSSGLDSAGRTTTVFSHTLSESPPTSTVDLPGLLAAEPVRQSPALAPLSIPVSAGPSLNLIQPTPHTARPPDRKKGRGTLDFEKVLGELVSNEEDRHIASSSSTHQQPPQVFSNPSFAPLTAEGLQNFTTHPLQSTAHQQLVYPFQFGPTPPLPFPDYLAPTARTTPSRQRSKSETDIMAPLTQFENYHPLGHNQELANQWPRQPLPPLVDHNGNPVPSAWNPNFHPAQAGTNTQFRFANLELASMDEQQRELEGGRSSRAQLSKRPIGGVGTPGYQTGLGAPVDDLAPPGGHRRSRSHGGGHRPSKSEEIPLEFGSPALGGRLTPQSIGRVSPTPPPSSHQLGFAPPPPNGSFATNQPEGMFAFNQQPQQSNQQQQYGEKAPSFGPQRTPYVYHSPAASPLPTPDDAGVGDEAEGTEEVIAESKTTAATIEAAMRRRNPGTAARFACDLCGETFTRRYNLKGHQRAHRNEKPFTCSYDGCDKAFARSHDCKRHELLHLGVRRYHCDPCARTFVRLDALQRHHRSEIGQACVQALRDAGFVLGYETSVVTGASL